MAERMYSEPGSREERLLNRHTVAFVNWDILHSGWKVG